MAADADRDARKQDAEQDTERQEGGPAQPEDVRTMPKTAFDPASQPTTNPNDRTGAQPGGDTITTPQDVEKDD